MLIGVGVSSSPLASGVKFFFFQAEDGIRDKLVTGVQTCALPICADPDGRPAGCRSRAPARRPAAALVGRPAARLGDLRAQRTRFVGGGLCPAPLRSEERRVGKEGRSRWSPYH